MPLGSFWLWQLYTGVTDGRENSPTNAIKIDSNFFSGNWDVFLQSVNVASNNLI
jgi:hypothetical protein